jgi:hypothetical protein
MAGPTAGTGTLTTIPSEFFTDQDGCTSLLVRCTAGTAIIHVPGLHAAGEGVPIASGSEVIFRLNHMGMKGAVGWTTSGSATVEFGVVAKTVS